jgi:hypothetical protein
MHTHVTHVTHRRYIIPQPVIDHFITDYERNGQYTGVTV